MEGRAFSRLFQLSTGSRGSLDSTSKCRRMNENRMGIYYQGVSRELSSSFYFIKVFFEYFFFRKNRVK